MSEQSVITPTVRRTALRSLFWVGVALFTLLFAFIALAIAGGQVEGVDLSASNPAPPGAMAVAEVLRHHGVNVTETSSLRQTDAAIDDAAATTLFIYDPDSLLSRKQLQRAAGLANHVVIADPAFDQLRAIAPGVAQAGPVTKIVKADCGITAIMKAGTVSGTVTGYRVVTAKNATRCLGSGDGVYSLIQLTADGNRTTILGATDALTNEHATEAGNAALALNLLGEKQNLVWYLPSLDDVAAGGGPTLAQLTPAWVTPVMALLLLTFIAAAVWRGRRFGPLVIENLPVVVRASETMLGRARLYERSSARLRALDSLRIGTIQRLASLCGLPRLATVDAVIATVAEIVDLQPAEVRRILVDAEPRTDRELLTLSDALLSLERSAADEIRA
ncbi:MAG: DUF4350 domain-containing protein [Salinibacterium sp.]|nr:MAG: DUF4350 domain-containing protein [Salinibacterium sp.]